MVFTIPDKAAAAYVEQSGPDSVDFDALVAAFGRTGVDSGCAVTVVGGNMQVSVAAGTVEVAGQPAAVAGGTLTLGAADATNPRFDLIVASSAGAISAVAGVAAAAPVYPAIPANSVLLAAVDVRPAATALLANMVGDKRVMLVAQPRRSIYPLSTASSWSKCMPQPVPIHSGTFVAQTAYVDLIVTVSADFAGIANAQFDVAWCDATLDRQPHPRTQTEFVSGVSGIVYAHIGGVWPLALQSSKATAAGGSGGEMTVVGIVRSPLLTPGHTYNWELLFGVVGGGSVAAPVDTGTNGRPAVVRSQSTLGLWKAYLCSSANNRVDVAMFNGIMPSQMACRKIRSLVSAQIGTAPVDVIASRNQKYVVILCSTRVNVVDAASDFNLGNYTPGFDPKRGDISPDSTVLAFIGNAVGSLNVMNLATGVFGTAVTGLGANLADVKFNPAGTAIWVLDNTNKQLRGWNFAAGAIGTAIGNIALTGTLATNPDRFTISADGTRAWVTDTGNSVLIEVNLSTLTQTRTLALPQAGSYVGCERFDGSDDSLLVVAAAGSAGGTQVMHVNLNDWTIYTTWANNLGAPGATNANAASGGLCLTGSGDILISDNANFAINNWPGCLMAYNPTYFLSLSRVNVEIAEVAAT